jgi:hypothetical protein
LLLVGRCQSLAKVFDQAGKLPGKRSRPGDQNIVIACAA